MKSQNFELDRLSPFCDVARPTYLVLLAMLASSSVAEGNASSPNLMDLGGVLTLTCSRVGGSTAASNCSSRGVAFACTCASPPATMILSGTCRWAPTDTEL